MSAIGAPELIIILIAIGILVGGAAVIVGIVLFAVKASRPKPGPMPPPAPPPSPSEVE